MTLQQMSTKKQIILLFQEGQIISTDALVPRETAAVLFGIKLSSFDRNHRKISARHGLQRVKTGGTFKFRLQSIQDVIRKCAETGEALFDTDQGKIKQLYHGPKVQ